MTGCVAFLSHSTRDDHAMAADGFSVQEERLNAATHAAGALLSVVGMVWLIVRAGSTGQSGSVTVSTVYGAALVLLYLFSALHHAVSHPRTKQIFLALDHCGIYLLIAGTYTPFMLLMPAGQGWLLLSFVWSVAAVGIALQMGSFIAGRSDDYERFAFVLYLAMGWGPLFWVIDASPGTPPSPIERAKRAPRPSDHEPAGRARSSRRMWVCRAVIRGGVATPECARCEGEGDPPRPVAKCEGRRPLTRRRCSPRVRIKLRHPAADGR